MSDKDMDAAALHRHAEEASQFLKAIANPIRLLILCTLVQGEYSVGELNDKLELSQSTLSQHLAILRRQNLVQTRREGQTIFYSLRSDEVRLVMECLYEIYCSS